MMPPMTPRKRARPTRCGTAREAGVTAPTPHRHMTMTANDNSPGRGQDSTELAQEGFPLDEATNEELALVLEEEVQKLREATEAVDGALLNEDVPLTGEKVERLWTASDAVTALSRTLSIRVDEAHRIEDDDASGDHQ